MDEPTPSAEAPRSRRALLAGLAGGLGAWAASAVERATPVAAASGDPVRMGRSNLAGGTNTTVTTTTSGAALRVVQGGTGVALRGESASGNGAYLQAAKPGAYGLYARNTATTRSGGAAILADGGHNAGIKVRSRIDVGSALEVLNSSNDVDSSGIYAQTVNGAAVFAAATGTASANAGVWAYSNSPSGWAVYGANAGTFGAAIGVYGHTASYYGIAVRGEGPGEATGVFGSSVAGIGVRGDAAGGYGVWGRATNGAGVRALATTGFGVFAESSSGTAGYFGGNVQVTGSLSKGGGTFRIDHPLDPTRKYLQHSFVESPDMLNLYNGIVTADARGRATIELPPWFDALNRDFRYALAPIGAPMPELHVAAEIEDNRFRIAGAAPGARVSWQVTGIRHDAWANANRVEVEIDKTGAERGRYLHPKEHGKPASKGMGYEVLVSGRPR